MLCPGANDMHLGWDAGVALYLVLIYQITAHASIARISQRAAINDEGAIALLALTTAAALASLAAVVAELGHTPSAYKIALGIGTILLSWTFVHVIFALHYAYEFYADRAQTGGLVLPGIADPDYWDFLVLLASRGHDRAGVGRSNYQQGNPSAHDFARGDLVLLQPDRAGVDREYRV